MKNTAHILFGALLLVGVICLGLLGYIWITSNQASTDSIKSSSTERYITRIHSQLENAARTKSEDVQYATISFKQYISEKELVDFINRHSLQLVSVSWNVDGAGGPSAVIEAPVAKQIEALRADITKDFVDRKNDYKYLEAIQTNGMSFGSITVSAIAPRTALELWRSEKDIRLIEMHRDKTSFGGGLAPEQH